MVAGGAVDLRQKCRGHLGVRLRTEGDAIGQQLLLEEGVVLDDAVVDQRELVVIGQVRVGIDVGWTAMGGPAGMADADRRLVHSVLLGGVKFSV